MPRKQPKKTISSDDVPEPQLWGLEPREDVVANARGDAFPLVNSKRAQKGDRIAQLEEALERAQKKARGWEMAYLSSHRNTMRLIAMLLDLGVPAEKLADWQKALDHIEAVKMNGMSRVRSVVLDAAREDLNAD